MKKVVVFGDLPIATKIVQFLEKMENVDINVVIGNESPHNHDPWHVPCLVDYVNEKNDIKILTLDDIATKYKDREFTLGLSCRYSKIIKYDVIRKFEFGIINMHGGLLPEFAGLCSANHTLLNNSKVGGGTLHYIDEGIDTGEIIKRCEFEIKDDDTAYDVFQKTQITLEKNMENIIPRALNQWLDTISQKELIEKGHLSNYYNKKDLEIRRCIKLEEINNEDTLRVIRAFDFPGYEPAYFIDLNGNKVYLRYSYEQK